MPLDPQAQQVMNQIAALGFPPPHMVTPEQARHECQSTSARGWSGGGHQ